MGQYFLIVWVLCKLHKIVKFYNYINFIFIENISRSNSMKMCSNSNKNIGQNRLTGFSSCSVQDLIKRFKSLWKVVKPSTRDLDLETLTQHHIKNRCDVLDITARARELLWSPLQWINSNIKGKKRWRKPGVTIRQSVKCSSGLKKLILFYLFV